jgi:hypothetical protein
MDTPVPGTTPTPLPQNRTLSDSSAVHNSSNNSNDDITTFSPALSSSFHRRRRREKREKSIRMLEEEIRKQLEQEQQQEQQDNLDLHHHHPHAIITPTKSRSLLSSQRWIQFQAEAMVQAAIRAEEEVRPQRQGRGTDTKNTHHSIVLPAMTTSQINEYSLQRAREIVLGNSNSNNNSNNDSNNSVLDIESRITIQARALEHAITQSQIDAGIFLGDNNNNGPTPLSVALFPDPSTLPLSPPLCQHHHDNDDKDESFTSLFLTPPPPLTSTTAETMSNVASSSEMTSLLMTDNSKLLQNYGAANIMTDHDRDLSTTITTTTTNNNDRIRKNRLQLLQQWFSGTRMRVFLAIFVMVIFITLVATITVSDKDINNNNNMAPIRRWSFLRVGREGRSRPPQYDDIKTDSSNKNNNIDKDQERTVERATMIATTTATTGSELVVRNNNNHHLNVTSQIDWVDHKEPASDRSSSATNETKAPSSWDNNITSDVQKDDDTKTFPPGPMDSIIDLNSITTRGADEPNIASPTVDDSTTKESMKTPAPQQDYLTTSFQTLNDEKEDKIGTTSSPSALTSTTTTAPGVATSLRNDIIIESLGRNDGDERTPPDEKVDSHLFATANDDTISMTNAGSFAITLSPSLNPTMLRTLPVPTMRPSMAETERKPTKDNVSTKSRIAGADENALDTIVPIPSHSSSVTALPTMAPTMNSGKDNDGRTMGPSLAKTESKPTEVNDSIKSKIADVEENAFNEITPIPSYPSRINSLPTMAPTMSSAKENDDPKNNPSSEMILSAPSSHLRIHDKTAAPTNQPTRSTYAPTKEPSNSPTKYSSHSPTVHPSTSKPTLLPTSRPTHSPTFSPTRTTPVPTLLPTIGLTHPPTFSPTRTTPVPTVAPTLPAIASDPPLPQEADWFFASILLDDVAFFFPSEVDLDIPVDFVMDDTKTRRLFGSTKTSLPLKRQLSASFHPIKIIYRFIPQSTPPNVNIDWSLDWKKHLDQAAAIGEYYVSKGTDLVDAVTSDHSETSSQNPKTKSPKKSINTYAWAFDWMRDPDRSITLGKTYGAIGEAIEGHYREAFGKHKPSLSRGLKGSINLAGSKHKSTVDDKTFNWQYDWERGLRIASLLDDLATIIQGHYFDLMFEDLEKTAIQSERDELMAALYSVQGQIIVAKYQQKSRDIRRFYKGSLNVDWKKLPKDTILMGDAIETYCRQTYRFK